MDMQHESSSSDVVMRGAEGADTEPPVESIASGSKRKLETALEDDSSKKAKTGKNGSNRHCGYLAHPCS